ncbi:MAG: 1-(5-phosphoribosyl)-5-[(5-phosphoribosylamino)methylideneamino]imidazole-4-carboxamide isomerase [Candidatus Kapaibacterium sp.]|jgi:phosphoribosylformimino-5-aminoimidazole carboxamide ribotide isomerase
MRIIPAIDILGGKCVRLTQGNYNSQKIYNENPLEVAKAFEANGVQYLHLVDLDGAKSHRIVHHTILENIVKNTSLSVDFGGGVKSDNDVKIAFECGASQITVGSVAVHKPSIFIEWLHKYGNDKILLGADTYNGKIVSQGWLDHSENDVMFFIKEYVKRGIMYVVCTDVAKDGMLQGISYELYKQIIQNIDVRLIASGGVSSIDDIRELQKIGCEGAIIGKALYEGNIALQELQSLW